MVRFLLFIILKETGRIGTFGDGTETPGLQDSDRIVHGHRISTLATALRVPVSGFVRKSLIKEEDGVITPTIPLGKTI